MSKIRSEDIILKWGLVGAKILAGLGFLFGVLYGFGGLILGVFSTVETSDFSWRTVLALSSIILIPLFNLVIVVLAGVLLGLLYKLFLKIKSRYFK